jgi:hypothetical protein
MDVGEVVGNEIKAQSLGSQTGAAYAEGIKETHRDSPTFPQR